MIFMPPHCDTLDGPVVLAAKHALETGNVNFILPWVYEGGEHEVREAFEKALKVRKLGNKDSTALADLWFFETTVRVHRQGEGAPYTGLKPAGLDVGPMIPRVDKALKLGNPTEIMEYLHHTIEHAIHERFEKAYSTKTYDPNNVKAAREHVQAYLGLTLFSHHLYTYIQSGGAHSGEEGEESGEHESSKHEQGEPKKGEHHH